MTLLPRRSKQATLWSFVTISYREKLVGNQMIKKTVFMKKIQDSFTTSTNTNRKVEGNHITATSSLLEIVQQFVHNRKQRILSRAHLIPST